MSSHAYAATPEIAPTPAVTVIASAPEHLRRDNGPELSAYSIQDWLDSPNQDALHPARQSLGERTHRGLPRQVEGRMPQSGTLWFAARAPHHPCLARRIQRTTSDSSLSYQTPGEFARHSNNLLPSPSGLLPHRVALNLKTDHTKITKLQL